MKNLKCTIIFVSLVASVTCSPMRTKRQGDFRYLAINPYEDQQHGYEHHATIHGGSQYGHDTSYGDAPSHPLTNQLAPSGHPTIDALRGSASTYVASALGLAFGPFGSYVGAFSKPHLADAFYYLTNGALARSASSADNFGNTLEESRYQNIGRSSLSSYDDQVKDVNNMLSEYRY